MKFFLFLLLLANGALFAYHQGYLQEIFPSDHEPHRIKRQLNAEKVRLLPADQALQTPTPDPGAVASSSASASVSSSASVSASASSVQETIACLEIGDFSVAEAKRFETGLTPLALGDRQTRRNVPEIASYIVYIPPLPSKEAADKKASELRGLKVNDFFIINDPNSALRWSISLGTFKTKLAASSHLEILTKQGVRSAALGTRNTAAGKVAYQLHGITPELKAKIDDLTKGLANQQQKACSKP